MKATRPRQLNLVLLALCLMLCTCDRAPAGVATEAAADANPPARGFDLVGSDPEAIAIADSIVAAHGGRRAYDATRYLKWNFFGFRDLTWDKQGRRARIEVPSQNAIYLLDYSTDPLSGRVRIGDIELTGADSLAQYLGKANSALINDSYWLVHQFKLLDSGVTLKKLDDAAADPQNRQPSYVLELTFTGVGDTPQNRYVLFVDKKDYRINTWQFFRTVADEEPAMETPWNGYRQYGDLQLSGDRGGRYQLNDISLPEAVDESVFTAF